MSIKVLAPVEPPKGDTYISDGEAVLIRKIAIAFGRVDAVRVARAFAKCDLRSAVEYVDSILKI